jgi:hypothetical protein
MSQTLLFGQGINKITDTENPFSARRHRMNLSCIVTVGLAGVIAVTLIYYFFTEWNAE